MMAATAASMVIMPSALASTDAKRAACVCNWLWASEQSLSAILGVIILTDTRPS